MPGRLLRRLPRRRKNKLKGLYYDLRKALVRRFRSYDAAALRERLRSLGIRAGDSVMVHAAFDGLSGFQGTIAALTDTMIDAVGPDGHLLMVSLPYRSSSRQYLDSIERFDIRKVPSAMGLVSEFFRRRRNVVRSLHPTHPVLVSGPDADWFVEGHESCRHPCGAGTPFARLAERSGKVLFFNVTFATFTFFHFLEDMLKERLPFELYHRDAYRVPMIDREGRPAEVTTFVFSDETIRRRRFPVLEAELRRQGIIRRSRVGNTRLELVELPRVIECVRDMVGRGVYFYDMAPAAGGPVADRPAPGPGASAAEPKGPEGSKQCHA